jgi:glucosamine--fructose-6-phosphate aminotransferase (isomerizing)
MEGLRTLEYRGYDSAGVALARGGEMWTARKAGKVAELAEVVEGVDEESTFGIGHTRWATCGAPTERNAHPHRDCSETLALVHNGIIENHLELRARLEGEGHEFRSETDTEVVVHLVEANLKEAPSLLEATRRVLAEIKGTLAVVLQSSDQPSTIVGARIDAPLIVGIGDGENFLASDVTALIEHTRRVVPLKDREIVEITPEGIRLIDFEGNDQPIEEIDVTWDHEAAEKSGYDYFMLKEIHEQPSAVRDTLRGRSLSTGKVLLDEIRMSDEEVRSLDKVFVVACGSSFHAGLVAKHAIEHWNRLPVEIDIASEFRYRDPVLDAHTLVIGISQSGETADTLAAIRYARQQGARVVAITNVVGSSITRESDAVLYTHAGPEVGVAATKTLTTQMAALWLLALWIAQVRGTMYPHETKQLIDHMWAVPGHMEAVLRDDANIRRVAEKYSNSPTFLFIGRGVGVPVALEGALKLKEISYLHAEGLAAGEMKHGPIALLEQGVPVIALATKSHVQAKLLSNAEEAKARGADVVAVANPGDREVAALADEIFEVPETSELLAPAIDVLPLQLLAYHVATLRGCDPDRPRNLAKSVTVE